MRREEETILAYHQHKVCSTNYSSKFLFDSDGDRISETSSHQTLHLCIQCGREQTLWGAHEVGVSECGQSGACMSSVCVCTHCSPLLGEVAENGVKTTEEEFFQHGVS